MSNTRYADGTGPMRQERYASSQEFMSGLIANLVAKRCTVLERVEDRELVWFIQLLSHRAGGLKRFAAELCELFPERLATPAMRQIGTKPGQVYNAGQVEQARAEIPGGAFDFRLRGELDEIHILTAPDGPRDVLDNYTGDWKRERDSALDHAERHAQKHPVNYRAEVFEQHCRQAAVAHLERQMADLCLDPQTKLIDGEPWYFPTLISTLREYQAAWIAERAETFVTSIGRLVYDALDYAREMRRLVLVDGLPRIGKSHAAQTWCELNAGCARYVQVPSTNDEIGFFREIAKALGISSGLGCKAVELRERIENVLHTGQLMLVFDEAHYAFPTNNCRNTQPGRINWIMTALLNKGVPVALVTTPQFFRTQSAIEKATSWTSAQFTGRIGHYEKLPEVMPRADLVAVARSLVPEAAADSIEALVIYASNSQKYIEGIKAVRDRARFILKREGRQKLLLRDVMRAIDGSVMPSDAAFASALNAPAVEPARRQSRQPVANVPSTPLQRDCKPAETASAPARNMRPLVVEESEQVAAHC